MSDLQDFPSEAIAALERGSKIDAIKCVRVSEGCSLMEAKEKVEKYIRQHPSLQSQMAEENARSRMGCIRLLIFLGILGALAYYFLKS